MEVVPVHSLEEVKREIKDGDLLLFEGRWLVGIGGLISVSGRSKFQHIGMAVWCGDQLMCMHFTLRKGGHMVTLEDQVRRYPGKIHVYRPLVTGRVRKDAVKRMLAIMGNNYAAWKVTRAALSHIPVARAVFKPQYNNRSSMDCTKEDYLKSRYCSEACSWAYNCSGGDIVENLADEFTEPGDMSRGKVVPLFSLIL